MIRTLLFSTLFFLTQFSIAQEVTVSNAAGYAEQVFYRLSDDATTTVKNESWDIAFTTTGLQDAGIHVNESAGFQFGSTTPEIEVYEAPTNIWSNDIDVNDLTDRLYNDDKSWGNGGAFNQGRDESDFFDYGWGHYDRTIRTVVGDKVFAVKLRDGSWKKVQFQNLAVTEYNFRYADLDGSNTVTQKLEKTDHENSTIMLFSFETGDFLPELDTWDLTFTRYATPVEQGGQIQTYVVTGVLANDGVRVAQADNVDPGAADIEDYRSELSSDSDIIGYDWKEFTGMSWALDERRAYFVQDLEGEEWKIRFLSFGGSGDGNTVFLKGDPVATVNFHSINQFAISPNPTKGQTQLTFNWNDGTQNLKAQLFDLQGKELRNYDFSVNAGSNTIDLNGLPNESGMYILQITDGQQSLVSKLVIE